MEGTSLPETLRPSLLWALRFPSDLLFFSLSGCHRRLTDFMVSMCLWRLWVWSDLHKNLHR